MSLALAPTFVCGVAALFARYLIFLPLWFLIPHILPADKWPQTILMGVFASCRPGPIWGLTPVPFLDAGAILILQRH